MLTVTRIGSIALASILMMSGNIKTGGDMSKAEQNEIVIAKTYETIIDDEKNQEIVAEVQINEPIYYTKTKAASKPPEYIPVQTPPPIPKQPTHTNEEYEYVEGFGYVKKGGPTKVIIGASDEDINKIVGRME